MTRNGVVVSPQRTSMLLTFLPVSVVQRCALAEHINNGLQHGFQQTLVHLIHRPCILSGNQGTVRTFFVGLKENFGLIDHYPDLMCKTGGDKRCMKKDFLPLVGHRQFEFMHGAKVPYRVVKILSEPGSLFPLCPLTVDRIPHIIRAMRNKVFDDGIHLAVVDGLGEKTCMETLREILVQPL